MKRFFLVFPVTMVLMAGCMNMPTKTVQIIGTYTSDEEYKSWPCDKLSKEYNQLGERENILTTAQEQRYKSSQMQAFWLGFGQGDGVEAAELATVRGKRDAIKRALSSKTCEM